MQHSAPQGKYPWWIIFLIIHFYSFRIPTHINWSYHKNEHCEGDLTEVLCLPAGLRWSHLEGNPAHSRCFWRHQLHQVHRKACLLRCMLLIPAKNTTFHDLILLSLYRQITLQRQERTSWRSSCPSESMQIPQRSSRISWICIVLILMF